MNLIYVKQGDTLPSVEATLKFEDETVMDLTDCTVEFHMVDRLTKTAKVDTVATIVNPPGTDGKVRYDWASDGSDTDTPGRYLGEFEVTRPDNKKQTWPTKEPLEIVILEEYA